ncbi:unnamed protein product [Strongylus vulgaris]|uniref:Uncharacterized protein n=1 Tax=Strongylus vulgaris TaxID=40348 RepID=A0A3P7IMA2_STRVU|nr:unnamed protein product [Strongylus vulgaris]
MCFQVDEENEQFKRNSFVQQKERLANVAVSTEDGDQPDSEEDDKPQAELPTMDDADGSYNVVERSSSESDSEVDEDSLSIKKKLAKEKVRRKQEQRERHYQQYEEKLLQREAER